jgi:hypothetical protein
MPSLPLTGIADFVERVLENITRNQLVDLSMPLQKYSFAARWFDAKKRVEKGGSRLQWKLRTGNQGNAVDSGLYAKLDVGRKNVITHGHIDWTKQTVTYSFDIDEDDFASDGDTIFSRMMEEELGLYNDIFALMETELWSAPSSSTLNPMPAAGIPFWFQKYLVNSTVTATTPGFLGADPAGWTLGAGEIPTATYEAWKNWTGSWDVVTRDDLGEKILTALDMCDFTAPHPYPQVGGAEPSWGLYSPYSVYTQVRRQLELANDNLGREWGWGATGQPVVRGIPFEFVSYLANDTDDPVYGVNWAKTDYVYKQGNAMKPLPLLTPNLQPTVRVKALVNWGNFRCVDRRQGGFVLYKTP